MSKRPMTKHKLIIYRRLAYRSGNIPFLLIFLALGVLAIGWAGSNTPFLEFANQRMLKMLWEFKIVWIMLAGFSVVLYIITLMIGRNSFVQARPKALRIRGGFITLDVSYRRVKSITPVAFEDEYPIELQKGSNKPLANQLEGVTCIGVTLRGWPMNEGLLRTLWHKYMFLRSKNGLLLAVKDSSVLMNEIDNFVTVKQYQGSTYEDPIERALQQQKRFDSRR